MLQILFQSSRNVGPSKTCKLIKFTLNRDGLIVSDALKKNTSDLLIRLLSVADTDIPLSRSMG